MTAFETLESPDRELMAVARRAADGAAAIHRERSPDGREWSEKGRADFVTGVDLEAQAVILDAIADAFPDHAVVAEEVSGDGDDEAREPPEAAGPEPPMRWIVDPLDGTTNWLHGYPEYAVSIAVEDGRGLRAAVVLNSATGERFEAVRGAGAVRDGRPVTVSRVDDLEMALVGTGFPFKKPEYVDEYLRVFRRLLFRSSGVRRTGSAALDLCDLACGRLDAFWEHWLMPWDVAAGALILREAGGHLETFPLPDAGRKAAASGSPAEARESSAFTTTFASRRGRAYLGSNAALLEVFRREVAGGGGAA